MGAMGKKLLVAALLLFVLIGVAAWVKNQRTGVASVEEGLIEEVVLDPPSLPPPPSVVGAPRVAKRSEKDQIQRLFALDSSKLPIVETVSYTSRVPWLKGRPAWVSDYATHYDTSRHFIARSLNRSLDYFSQKISPGDRFNVFRRDKNIEFHLLVDLSSCRLWFYYVDQDTHERVLLKTYVVGVGRISQERESGCLTPIGTYSLGERVAVYQPGVTGFFQGERCEMIRIFGTRWIPFAKEVEGCSEEARGLGLHGAPWILDPTTGKLREDRSTLGCASSDGCIRLASEDIEEIFAIIVSRKPTCIQIVHTFEEAKLPGVEKP